MLRNLASFNVSVLHCFADFFVSLKDSATSMSLNVKLIFRTAFLKQNLKLNSYSTIGKHQEKLATPAVITYHAICMKPFILLDKLSFPQSN